MSIIVEDGTGLANAETYVSVADADTYHSALGNTAWAALDTTAKESALRRAAQYIDTRYTFRGSQLKPDVQALAWPRDLCLVWPIMRLKSATCELASRASTGNLYADQSGGEITKEKIGPLEVDYASSGLGGQTRYVLVDQLLQPLTNGGGRLSMRIERAS